MFYIGVKYIFTEQIDSILICIWEVPGSILDTDS